ncbi:hypothetical protein RDI58_001759 [Solanum bulbocastanum]|uniref:Uncharacterized protein n=1 Tax=Solanum bulbocastanum TaxID=147425 RepID=A0AAN8UCC0_SOLBU
MEKDGGGSRTRDSFWFDKWRPLYLTNEMEEIEVKSCIKDGEWELKEMVSVDHIVKSNLIQDENDKPRRRFLLKSIFSNGEDEKFNGYCCEKYAQETMSHLFLTAPITQKLWGFFATCAGINMEGEQLQLVVKKWWYEPIPIKLRYVYRAIPHLL